MGIWNTLRRFSARRTHRRQPNRVGGEKRLSANRGLRVEQFEERVLLSINPAGVDNDYLWNHTLANAIQRSSVLDSYQQDSLDATDTWVVGLVDASLSTIARALFVWLK